MRHNTLLWSTLALLWIAVPCASAQEASPPAEPAPATAPAAAQEPAADEAAAEVLFSRDVAPLLVKNCLGCHAETDPKGEYQLHTFERLMKEGYSGSPIVTPGDPDSSELLRLIASEEEEERMPKEAPAIPAEQVALVRRWIEQGAKLDKGEPSATLASIVPQERHPAAPAAYRVAVPITALAFRPDGAELAVGGYNEITIWNPNDGALLRRIDNVAERTYGVAYSPDGKLLAAASGTPGQRGEVRLYSAADGSLVRHLVSLADVAFEVAFSPDGTKLAACAADRSIRVFDVASGAEDVLIEDHADWVQSIAWSADGTKLASASRDKTSKVFDAKTGDSILTYPGHNDAVYAVAFNADGKQVLTGGHDKRIHIWDSAEGKAAGDLGGYGGDIFAVIFHGGQVFSCSGDRSVRQHLLDGRKEVRNFAGHSDWVYALGYNEPTNRLASGSYDGEIRVWNVADGALVVAFKAAPGLTQPAGAP